nr:uncharacterized protein LOC103352050 isoform X2 [Oryctolagus cuniculus]
MAMPYAEKRHSRRVDSLHRRPLLPLGKAWPSQPTVAISRQAGARAGEGKEVLFSPTELRSGLKSGEEMQGPWRQPSGHQPFVSWLSEADLFRDCSRGGGHFSSSASPNGARGAIWWPGRLTGGSASRVEKPVSPELQQGPRLPPESLSQTRGAVRRA